MTDKEEAKIRAEIIMSLKEGYKPKVKETAVEWLVEKLDEQKFITKSQIYIAEKMEKEQKIDFARLCLNKAKDLDILTSFMNAEQYYNETFKS